MRALVLAAEGIKNRDLWYPTILGVLVVIAAIGLFCGTVYMLLATNLGARLGFLVAIAGLSGFMVILSLLWLTTASPLNTLKGRIPQWRAVESLKGGDLARSSIPAVQTIHTTGRKVDLAEQANIKAAVDQVIVTPTLETGSTLDTAGSKFAIYQAATDYIVKNAYETGGGNLFSQFDVQTGSPFPWIHFSLHKPRYGVIDICPVDTAKAIVPIGEPIPDPVCDTSKPIQSLVFERDLGSVRVPPFVAFVAFSILFTISLLGLHWRERDLLERQAAANAEVERATPTPERTPEKV